MTTKSNIEKLDVKLPNSEDSGKLAFILLNVFTEEECSEWIKLTEERCYKPALVNVGVREVSMPDVRNNDRCIIDDVDMAKKLFNRIKSYLPDKWNSYQLSGLNERLRFLRYDPGQVFKGHMGIIVLFIQISCVSQSSDIFFSHLLMYSLIAYD
ncbi:unnamed protein product [Rotaria magnacalcarata]|uniref:Uncharacterized protein n=1 Tax=Rotaria magnacalcarata TaxID=392030 RepID=A0A8S3IRW4_9BILA|nr:unnamed protein product [Rotaria magnacalcarata]